MFSFITPLNYYWDSEEIPGVRAFYQTYEYETNDDLTYSEFIAVYDPVLMNCRYPYPNEIQENKYIPQSFK